MRIADTPSKRLGLVVMGCGLCAAAYGVSRFNPWTSVESCLFDIATARGCSATRWGVWTAAFGLLLLFLFDYTLKPFFRWIRHGKAARNR